MLTGVRMPTGVYKHKSVPAEIRFWAKVDKCGAIPAHFPLLGPCWTWNKTTPCFPPPRSLLLLWSMPISSHTSSPKGLSLKNLSWTIPVGSADV